MMPSETAMTLEDVRESAKQKLKGICGVFPVCDGNPNKVCQGNSYGKPLKFGGAGSGASFKNNFDALLAIRLKMRVVGQPLDPSTKYEFLGRKLAMPIMGASVAGVNSFGGDSIISEPAFCKAVVDGCKAASTIGWRGDASTYDVDKAYGIDAIAAAGGWGVQIVKPRPNDVIVEMFKKAERAGAAAVGVDLDGFGSHVAHLHAYPLQRKSFDDIKHLASSTTLPFIAKGIMGVEDATAAVDAGAVAVVVSNHGGRVLDHSPGTAEVLPAIAKAVGVKAHVLADGGVRTGYDVLKMLALGAEAVLVGRDVVRAAVGGGAYGVQLHMAYLQQTLAKAMKMTGCANVADISPSVLET
jgi:4-hydroxymandelate oxidase